MVGHADDGAGDPVAEFWDWFENAAPRVYESGDDAVNREDMAYWLGRIRPGLSYEIVRDGRKAELVLSADGNIGLFSAVEGIVGQAPKVRRWKFTALRPRARRLVPVTVDGVTIDPGTAYFDLYQDAARLGVVFYLPTYDPERVDAYRTAARRLMCQAVGERKVGNEVGFVDLDSPDVRDAQFSRPFSEFREVFGNLTR
jgi:hypothetical protein